MGSRTNHDSELYPSRTYLKTEKKVQFNPTLEFNEHTSIHLLSDLNQADDNYDYWNGEDHRCVDEQTACESEEQTANKMPF